MAVYEYKGIDAAGKTSAGVVDADSAKGARNKLRRQGVFTTEVMEQKAGSSTRGKGLAVEVDLGKLFARISTEDIATMTGQMATLIGAGIPMVEALSALIEQIENPKLKSVMVAVREDVNQGSGLAATMRKHGGKDFGDLYINMVAAGEQSGSLDLVLKRLMTYTESQVRLRGKVTSAMMYPALMGTVAILITVGLFVGVIPKIRRIFESMGTALPLITRITLGISDAIQGYWWLMIMVTAAIVYGWKLSMPIFGKVNRLVAVSRFCRTFSTLLDSGVPILTAVSIVATVVENDILSDAIQSAGKNIREGQSIAGPLKESGQFPPLVIHMIAIGEKTGELEPMLAKVADSYDQQVENILGSITSLIEPVMIIFMGGMVATIALAIMLPMLQMTQNLQH
jgi:general secretion pathway protein F